MAGTPDDAQWLDAQPFLERVCAGMGVGELLHGPSFSLFEATTAIEIGDPKMDIGMHRRWLSLRGSVALRLGRPEERCAGHLCQCSAPLAPPPPPHPTCAAQRGDGQRRGADCGGGSACGPAVTAAAGSDGPAAVPGGAFGRRLCWLRAAHGRWACWHRRCCATCLGLRCRAGVSRAGRRRAGRRRALLPEPNPPRCAAVPQATWHSGSMLPQTVFTSLYMLQPERWVQPAAAWLGPLLLRRPRHAAAWRIYPISPVWLPPSPH